MLSDGIADPAPSGENTGSVSVRGVKLTPAAGPAALVDLQTPPPVLPMYTVFPDESAGSIATAVIRPVTLP